MENQLCYFCDIQYPHPSCLMVEHNGIYACYNCHEIVPISTANQDGECCVCFENKLLINLPKCTHSTCLKCCKTIYFESADTNKPIHFRDVDCPDWPYEFDDENDNLNDPERVKYHEYIEFSDIHFHFNLTYNELIIIRDELIPNRSEWMNEEAFINYENATFLYYTTPIDSENLWKQYEANKIRGIASCPLCRS